MPRPRSIAILGGGITGLSTAYYLKKAFGSTLERLTVFEKSKRVGGWVQSQVIPVNASKIVFEHGPHSYKMDPEMLSDLNIQDQLITTNLLDAKVVNQYILFNGKPYTRKASSFTEFLKRPFGLQKLYLPMLLSKTKSIADLHKPDTDPTIYEYMSKKYSEGFADFFMASFAHGIFGGDSHQLSMRSCLPKIYDQDKAALSGKPIQVTTDGAWYNFKTGLGTLTTALSNDIANTENYKLELGAEVSNLEVDSEGKIAIKLNNAKTESFDTVISTLSIPKIVDLCQGDLPSTFDPANFPSVHMGVVNLHYEEKDIHRPLSGFGVLAPNVRFNENEEQLLGIIFDSDVFSAHHPVGSSFTVMLGGHYWSNLRIEDLPTDSELEARALRAMSKYLNVDSIPQIVRVTVHKNSIPQYPQHYDKHLKEAKMLVENFSSRVKLIGMFDYPSISSCMSSAKQIASELSTST